MSVSKARKESLLNEYKGYLFEFLVAQKIACLLDIETDFLSSVPKELFEMLKSQDQFVRNFSPELLTNLPILASELGSRVFTHLKTKSITQIELIGKLSSEKKYAEGDILCRSNSEFYPVSIKLTKTKSLVNTKSAGVRSFFSKYFSATAEQELFNSFFDQQYTQFAIELHEIMGISYDANFNNWVESRLPILPGDLNDECRTCYLRFLYNISNKLFDLIASFGTTHQLGEFVSPLIGQSSAKVIQAICFHSEGYKVGEYFVHDYLNLATIAPEFTNNIESSSCLLKFPGIELHIRLKSMNTFISKGFKVNCAVRYTG